MVEKRRAGLALLTALLVTVLPACYSWRATELSPRQYIADRRPPVARLVLTDGTLLAIEAPGIEGESIVGIPTGPPQRSTFYGSDGATRLPVRTPLAEVAAVEERAFNRGRTAVALTAVALTGVALLVSVFANQTHGTGCSPTEC